MTDLSVRVQQAITIDSPQLWWPGLARELAKFRDTKFGFAPEEYTTSQFLGRTSPVKVINVAGHRTSDPLELRLEVMPEVLTPRFACRGLRLLDASEVTTQARAAISKAISIICLIPSLSETVSSLVRSVHILRSQHADIDTSFSDPSIPFTVFLSIASGAQADLRIAEAVIHETMHLQLSLVEETLPLVLDHRVMYYSPWRKTYRPLAGVIHALYVFRVIDQWLSYIAKLYPNPSAIARRRAQIAEEISALDLTCKEVGLTPEGRRLVAQLLHGSNSSCQIC